MADLKDWKSLSKPDPEWEQWVQSIGGQAPDIGLFPDISSLRKWILDSKSAMSAQMGGKPPGVQETDHQVPMRDGATITCRTYQPEQASNNTSALAVVFHGGGWCIGGLQNEELLCRLLTTKLGMVCVNVDYRLAPEDKFPTAVNDCYDATKWAASQATSLKANPTSGFILSGTSAGGNMAAVLSHLFRDEKNTLPSPITGTHLMIPALCHHTHVPAKYRADYKSWEQNADAAILSQKACSLFMGNYLRSDADTASPLFSPFLFESGRKGLPPTYLQVCGADPLRDEALIFERVLREDEGVETKVDVYPGLPHGFWSVAPGLKASERFVGDSVKGVEWLLQRK